MITGLTLFKARRGIFRALRMLGILFFSALFIGCATSREDDYVASIFADAMANGLVEDQTSPDLIPSASNPTESSAPIPVVVSVAPSGTLSATPVEAVSVTVPASRAVTVPAEIQEPLAPPTEMPDPDAPESHPTPDAAVTVSVTPATSVTEPAAKVATVPQATNAAPDWHMGGMKPVIPTVQPDSVLWISVAEDPSLNGRYLVNNSSAIDFGYVGMVFLPDMTVEQAEKTIKTVLEGRYLTAAAVTVRIAKASYDVVGVMGSVQTPGEIKIGPGVAVSVSEVLRRAGGLKNERERLQVKIIRGGLRTPFGPAAEGEVYPLSSSDGRLRAPEVFLRNNDLAYVFAQQSGAAGGGGKRIILLGEVPRRGVIDFAESEPCTLMYLLFKIGGLPRFAKADRIKIVRRAKNGKETTFTVDGGLLMDKGDPSDDLVLESGDRVIVPARKIAFF